MNPTGKRFIFKMGTYQKGAPPLRAACSVLPQRSSTIPFAAEKSKLRIAETAKEPASFRAEE
jgi:hypothetical protein